MFPVVSKNILVPNDKLATAFVKPCYWEYVKKKYLSPSDKFNIFKRKIIPLEIKQLQYKMQ